jgi:hypothetical protein
MHNHHTFILHCYYNLKKLDFNVEVKNDCYPKFFVILFLNSVLTRLFSLGKPYIDRKIYLSSFHKKKSVCHFKFSRVRYVSFTKQTSGCQQ